MDLCTGLPEQIAATVSLITDSSSGRFLWWKTSFTRSQDKGAGAEEFKCWSSAAVLDTWTQRSSFCKSLHYDLLQVPSVRMTVWRDDRIRLVITRWTKWLMSQNVALKHTCTYAPISRHEHQHIFIHELTYSVWSLWNLWPLPKWWTPPSSSCLKEFGGGGALAPPLTGGPLSGALPFPVEAKLD